MRQAASDGYYEEAREGQIIPEGSRAQLGTPICVGPGLWRAMETSENSSSRSFANKGNKKDRDVAACSRVASWAGRPPRSHAGHPRLVRSH